MGHRLRSTRWWLQKYCCSSCTFRTKLFENAASEHVAVHFVHNKPLSKCWTGSWRLPLALSSRAASGRARVGSFRHSDMACSIWTALPCCTHGWVGVQFVHTLLHAHAHGLSMQCCGPYTCNGTSHSLCLGAARQGKARLGKAMATLQPVAGARSAQKLRWRARPIAVRAKHPAASFGMHFYNPVESHSHTRTSSSAASTRHDSLDGLRRGQHAPSTVAHIAKAYFGGVQVHRDDGGDHRAGLLPLHPQAPVSAGVGRGPQEW